MSASPGTTAACAGVKPRTTTSTLFQPRSPPWIRPYDSADPGLALISRRTVESAVEMNTSIRALVSTASLRRTNRWTSAGFSVDVDPDDGPPPQPDASDAVRSR